MSNTCRVFLVVAPLVLCCQKNPDSAQRGGGKSANVAARADSPASPVQAATVALTHPTADSDKKRPFICTPRVLGRRDTLTLRMKIPHGDYLIATQPDGTQFYIVYPTLGMPTRKFSLVPSERFKKMPRLQLPIDFRAKPNIYGRDTTERYFLRSGEYTLFLGRNLEGDFNPQSVACHVTFMADKD